VAGAIATLEDAVHLLRQAPPGTWLMHFAGTAPFALGLLRFSIDVTNPRTSDLACAIEAFVLALLLGWMNCWRSAFAGRLRLQLSGSAARPWTARRFWNLVSGQTFFGATKLVLLPAALLVMFPFAAVVAFYRYTAVLSGHEDLPPREMMAKARRLAGRDQRESAVLLAILLLAYLLLVINLGIVLAVLPQLARMMTGYESTFSRGGMYFVTNPLFVTLVFVVSWQMLDPLIQAVYCVRLFHAESVESGEDLRAALRRIAAALVLFLAVAAPRAFAVTPAELQQSVRQAMQAREYDWRLPPPAGTSVKPSWLAAFTDRVITGIQAGFHKAGELLGRLLRWLIRRGVALSRPGASPSAGLHWSLYGLIGAVAVAFVWIVWRRRRSRRTPETVPVTPAVRLDAEDLTPDRLPEERWVELAEQSLREGNPRLALRAFYLASLAWLGRQELLSINAGKTNREYERELRRRAREFPPVPGLFSDNVTAFERAWYGMHDVAREDVGEFRRRIDGMKTALSGQTV
jgi:hypothetical protein